MTNELSSEDKQRELINAAEDYLNGDITQEEFRSVRDVNQVDYAAATWELGGQALKNQIKQFFRGSDSE